MGWLKKVYNDVDANLMIMTIDQLAERYGYTSDMNNTIEIGLEDKWRLWDNFEHVTNNGTCIPQKYFTRYPTEIMTLRL